MNNRHYGISYDLYTYIREGRKEKREGRTHSTRSYEQPTEVDPTVVLLLLRLQFRRPPSRLFTRKLVKGDDETLKHLRLRVRASATLHATRSLGGLDFFLSTPYSTATRLGCQGERARS